MRSVVLLALAGCSSAPAATTDFFGPTVEPPRGLMWIQPGMSADEAMRLVPGLHVPDRKGVRDELVLDSNVSDVQLTVRLDGGTVSGIVAIVQGHGARDLLTRAWGPPQIAHDSLGQPEVTWASESTGWKVKLDCLERNCLVEYSPYHVLTSDFFGSHVIPPGELAKLRVGMKLADARTLAPNIIASRTGIPTSVDGVREFVSIDDKLGVVRSIYLNLPPHAEDLIAEAWSEGWKATELGHVVLVWPDPTTGWRATLRDALGYSHDLAYDNFMPASHLLGDQPDSVDALPQPILGRPVDEVKKAYKDDLLAGKELALSLPPTEWDRNITRIALATSDGKIRKVTFSLPYKPHPEARDTLLDLFKRKWGEPKDLEDSRAMLFHEEDPRVEIKDDTEHGAWIVELR
ncbi:MAG: hypothetical protein ABI678_27615 [Kofleriaceae bacterium]